ncbi:MAG: type I pullulanase [Chitinophagales bacterium]
MIPHTSSAQSNSSTVEKKYKNFDEYPTYEGNDLGLQIIDKNTFVFKIWSPTATAAKIFLYNHDVKSQPIETIMMEGPDEHGVFSAKIEGEKWGLYYNFSVKIDNLWQKAVPDPYARACGRNSQRAQIVNFAKTNPPHWEYDHSPEVKNFTDIILYELQVRDLSMHPQSGMQHKGKYLALTEPNTQTPKGTPTGLQHIRDLGITHVHLLPVYDFGSIDETKPQAEQYNWGYDPMNYNIPEGSYATDAQNGATRIKEFKQMVQNLHQNGLGVVIDVVYNHTYKTRDSFFEYLVPGYYYRQDSEGNFSNASACGNEIASERAMVRKMIVESVTYWEKEYHIDGFRFDLMGVLDQETMRQVRAALDTINPNIFIYGEGWKAGASPLPDSELSLKATTYQLPRIAAFSDDLRDAVKGAWHTAEDPGFIAGKEGMEESIKFGVVAATQHPEIDYNLVNYSKAAWAAEPFQCINYVSCHDNHTLWDKINASAPQATEADKIKMQLLANTIVLTSQGVPFIHAGTEMLRTKFGNHNSFESPDSINQIDWLRKEQYPKVFEYYQNLIALRKNHPAFRMPSTEMIQKLLHFLPSPPHTVAYIIQDNANQDTWQEILVFFNGQKSTISYTIPKKDWKVVMENDIINEAGIREISQSQINVPPLSATILVRE